MTRTKRTLKPAGYVALAVLGLLVIGLAMTAWSWVDTQFIHPYGNGIPTHLAATFTPTPQVVATQQLAATSELDALPPLMTATPTSASSDLGELGRAVEPPGASSKAVPLLSPTAPDPRVVGLPWAGKVAPGKPVPDEVVKSITASWDEMYKSLYDYQGIKANGKPGDKTWWIKQNRRFLAGAALDTQLQTVESWFKPGTTNGPGFIEKGVYVLNVKSCSSATECVLEINVQSGQWWAYSVADQQFSLANVVTPFQWLSVMQYDPAAGRWKFAEVR